MTRALFTVTLVLLAASCGRGDHYRHLAETADRLGHHGAVAEEELWTTLMQFHREVVRPDLEELRDEIKAVLGEMVTRDEFLSHVNAIYKRFDRLILVVCEEQQQIERAMARGATRDEAMARLASQMPLAEKRKYADYVIDTSREKEDTLRQTREVYNSLRSLKL